MRIEIKVKGGKSSARNLVFEDIGKGNGGEGMYKMTLQDHKGEDVAPEVYIDKEDIKRLAKAS